jgi:hypothetical protein
MCPQTPILSPEYSHKAGLQAVITSIPLQVRPVIQRRPRGARYNGPDHTWALGLNEDAPWEDVAAGLRQSVESCEGCPCPLCLCRTSGCSEGLERRVASLPSPQHPPWAIKGRSHDVTRQIQLRHSDSQVHTSSQAQYSTQWSRVLCSGGPNHSKPLCVLVFIHRLVDRQNT